MTKESLSSEQIAAVKDIVPEVLGVSFDEMFQVYQENNPDLELSETDLVSEILEAGNYQAEDDSTFEDCVMIDLYSERPILELI